mmetsp:Transcript_1964/g.5906  ORF Transcript_1964/g.5906 Transcript_1964/m.5906 type:complete len:215 (+) Transcript_1964:2379-3023(+)
MLFLASDKLSKRLFTLFPISGTLKLSRGLAGAVVLASQESEPWRLAQEEWLLAMSALPMGRELKLSCWKILLGSCLIAASPPRPPRKWGCMCCLLELRSSMHWLLEGRNCDTAALWNRLALACSFIFLPPPTMEASTIVAITRGCLSRSDMRRDDASMLPSVGEVKEEEERGFSAISFACIFCFLRARPALGCQASWNLETTSRKRSTEQTLAT